LKVIKLLFALFCIAILFASCGSNSNETKDISSISNNESVMNSESASNNESITNSESASGIEKNDNNPNEAYNKYSGKISAGLNNFRTLSATSKDEDVNSSTLIVEEKTVLGISTEGAKLTRFMTPQNKIVRYTIDAYGETGKSISNYYFIDDGLVYVQQLHMDYADWNFVTNERFDILKYELTDYLTDGTKTFMIDDANKKAIEAEDVKLYSLEELNGLFLKS